MSYKNLPTISFFLFAIGLISFWIGVGPAAPFIAFYLGIFLFIISGFLIFVHLYFKGKNEGKSTGSASINSSLIIIILLVIGFFAIALLGGLLAHGLS